VLGGKINEAAKNRIGYLPEERGLTRISNWSAPGVPGHA